MSDHVITSFEPDKLYVTPPPWDLGRPQSAFLELAESGAIRGRALDVGCGTGEHALMCARRGLDVTGIDLAGSAMDAAKRKARERRLDARFLRHDVLRVAELGESFDTVIDCGLFHMPHFTPADRAAYVAGLTSVLNEDGHCFMLCFSDRVPVDQTGPHRLTRDEITSWFADGWHVRLEPATIEVTIDPAGRPAWLVDARRT